MNYVLRVFLLPVIKYVQFPPGPWNMNMNLNESWFSSVCLDVCVHVCSCIVLARNCTWRWLEIILMWSYVVFKTSWLWTCFKASDICDDSYVKTVSFGANHSTSLDLSFIQILRCGLRKNLEALKLAVIVGTFQDFSVHFVHSLFFSLQAHHKMFSIVITSS